MEAAIGLVGPTGIGKTAVALAIAGKTDCEIISADSRQIYKYLDIGTAKPSPQQLRAVPHHFISMIEPPVPYSAGKFGREARNVTEQIIKRNKLPLIVGGAGFYIQALIDGLSDVEVNAGAVRDELRKRWEAGEADAIFAELSTVDPQIAAHLKKTDKQRVIRALEVYLAGRQQLSELHKRKPSPAGFNVMMFGLSADRPVLYEKINARVEMMLAQGLIEEVRGLQRMGYDRNMNALNTVGYKEVFEYFEKKLSYDELVQEIKKNSRRYAKRQLTWFRRDNRIQWLDICQYKSAQNVAEHILNIFTRKKNS